MTFVRSISDLAQSQIDWVLSRSRFHLGQPTLSPSASRTVVGLAFLEPSLRTRVGFAAAAIRLGATPVEVQKVRSSDTSKPERIQDTLRTLAGYSDLVVARVPEQLSLPTGVVVPVLNGGDGGPRAEHPSQAIVDLFALEQFLGGVDGLTIAMCGDLRMRAARSLLLLLADRLPKRLLLVTEPELLEGFELPDSLRPLTEFTSLGLLAAVDALYVVGLPFGVIDEPGRTRLRVSRAVLDSLPKHAAVLSPLPVIDEMEIDAISHPRVRMYEQSDNGLFVRMSLLELMLGHGQGAP